MSEPKRWIIMIYLAGDNNLSTEMVWAIKELYRVAPPEGVVVTVQFDPRGLGQAPRRHVITSADQINEDGVLDLLGEPPLAALPGGRISENSGKADTLADFIAWSLKRDRDACSMLVLSGHGGGPVGDFLTDDNTSDGIRGSLSIPDLAVALTRASDRLAKSGLDWRGAKAKQPLIDVLGMDSCLMSTAEVLYEVRDHVEYVVASEGLVANTGWPYFRILERLRRQAGPVKPAALGEIAVDAYADYYADYILPGASIDIALCDLVGQDARGTSGQPRIVESFAGAVNALARALREILEDEAEQADDDLGPVTGAVVLAHWRAQSYRHEQYTDLWDFCHCLEKALGRLAGVRAVPQLTRLCQDVKAAIGNQLVLRSESAGPEFQHSHGLSVYFPWSRANYTAVYDQVAFATDTEWSAFLRSYVTCTQRRASKPSPALAATGRQELVRPQGAIPNTAVAGAAGLSANRTGPPADRTGPPADRTGPPADRLADVLEEAFGLRCGDMKNPATEYYIVHPSATADKVKELKDKRRQRTMAQYLPPPAADRVPVRDR
jgi:hypothetical protein